MRCDLPSIINCLFIVIISIHAPTWGATYILSQLNLNPCYFNPRTYVRCDQDGKRATDCKISFQSTHLHEVRLGGAGTYIYVAQFQSTHLREVRPYTYLRVSWPRKYFNPRTYVRCDKIAKLIQYIYMIFQSTHLREVRQLLMWFIFAYCLISIHAPTWGATSNFPYGVTYAGNLFQSTHLREVRRVASSR